MMSQRNSSRSPPRVRRTGTAAVGVRNFDGMGSEITPAVGLGTVRYPVTTGVDQRLPVSSRPPDGGTRIDQPRFNSCSKRLPLTEFVCLLKP